MSCPQRTSLLSPTGEKVRTPPSDLKRIESCFRKSADGGRLFKQRPRSKEKDCPHETQHPPAPDCDHRPGRFVRPGKSNEARRGKSPGIKASFLGEWILISAGTAE